MRYLQIGLGNIGARRARLLGSRCAATVDPASPSADFAECAQADGIPCDAVILSVPNQAKVALAARYLERGIHVLVEKPLLFGTRAEADELLARARAHRVACITSYNHRHEPAIQKARELLKGGALGRFYHGRFHYGNGTVRNLVGTWRESGRGVLEDLACHMLDLDHFLLGQLDREYRSVALRRFELGTYDYALLFANAGSVQIEVSFVEWKNTFRIDLYGERGSLHVDGLKKWGRSALVHRERILPSGAPHEAEFSYEGEDLSWNDDLRAFEEAAAAGRTSIEEDWHLSQMIAALQEARIEATP